MENGREEEKRWDDMLYREYASVTVPQEVKCRMKNQLACKQTVEKGRISFWWLPATVNTVICAAVSVILFLVYIIINIQGACSWMPNLLLCVSGAWLKLHLVLLAAETVAGWLMTLAGIWKANLFWNAKIL